MNTYANEIPATVYGQARDAGLAAAEGCTPTPMVVGQPTTPLGNDIDTLRTLTMLKMVCVVSHG